MNNLALRLARLASSPLMAHADAIARSQLLHASTNPLSRTLSAGLRFHATAMGGANASTSRPDVPADPLEGLRSKTEQELMSLIKPLRAPQQPPSDGAAGASGEEEEEEDREDVNAETGEVHGPRGKEPTRFGDWENKGRCTDF